MNAPMRLAMWSGPRNISTAMMRSFGSRPDTAVVDEPFYAVYLGLTGIEHPMREEVLASQSQDWRAVTDFLLGPVPGGKSIFYQKHMTHHMLPEIDLGWMARCVNVFLIRDPKAVLASYIAKRADVDLSDIGIVRQRQLFELEADRIGAAPPVIDGGDVLANPREVLGRLCTAIGIEFSEDMLQWPAGQRATDGVWAPAWYAAVERSTGFEPPKSNPPVELSSELNRIYEAALPHYEALTSYRLC